MIKAIVFDMDGTIIDSDALVKQSFLDIFHRFRPDIDLSPSFLNTLTAPSYHEVFSTYFKEPEELLIPMYMEVQLRERHHLLRLFPHVEETLKELKANNYSLVLWTSEVETITKEELTLLGIYHYFDFIVTRDHVHQPKPSPEGMELIINKLNVHKHEILFIGDQPTDWEAARASMVHLGAVSWSPMGIERLSQYQPELVINDWNELIPWLTNRQKEETTFIPYDFVLKMKKLPFRAIQFTDLHLMDNAMDPLTYLNIKKAIETYLPDLVVITGDLTMSNQSRRLYSEFSHFMNQFHIPWTFGFGNHDTDHGVPYEDLLKAIEPSPYLKFTNGPTTIKGYGNFSILIETEDAPIQLMILLDSHVDTMYPIGETTKWGYANLHWSQVNYVHQLLSQTNQAHPTLKNLIFFHIPTPEYHQIESIPPISGERGERPSTPPFNSGLVDMVTTYGTTQAIFVGHDHYDDYVIPYQGLLLVYGRVSGHYDYGVKGFPKGARLIDIDSNGTLSTSVIFEKDYVL